MGSEHLRRYRDIAWLLWKHGRSDWVEASGLDRQVKNGDFRAEPGGPDSLAKDLESLGPTFIKVGQLLAGRADLLPPPYLKALGRLHADVEPIAFEKIEEVIAAELKAKPSRIFSTIDPQPLATASLAQVHRATLRDDREVVVKVQRPEVEEQVRLDFEAFASLAKLGANTAYGRKYRIEELVSEFHRAIEEELDYRCEADNLLTIRQNLAEFKLIQIPRPILDFSSRRVLTMERISGTSVSSISPVVLTEVSGSALAHELFAAYLKQMLIDGFFHADPHPGNVFLTHDHGLGLLDLGMVGRLDSELQEGLLTLLLAVSEGRGREAAEVALRIGTLGTHFKREAFFERVSDLVMRSEHSTVADMEAGRVVLQIQQIAGDTGIRLPRSLTLVAKALLNLDSIGRCLDPDFNPNEAIRRHALDLVKRRMWARLTPNNLLQSSLEMSEFVARLPRRLNDFVTQMGKTGIRLDVDAFDEKTFVSGFQKVANRITTGLILGSLIVGAALLMRVETKFTLFGYPGLAIVLFLCAAAGGAILLYQIMIGDRRDKDDRYK